MASRPERSSAPAKRDYPVAIGLAFIHLVALGVFVPALFSWQAVLVAVMLYYVTGGIGITLAFHRLLTHRSLAVPRAVECVLVICGTLAMQGGPIEWVATHRKHHANTDRDGDPHDSHRGMGWAHIEWLYRTNKDRMVPAERAYWAPDLVKNPFYRFLDTYIVPIQIAFGFVLLFIGGWSWVIWGMFARLVFTYHCTWLVNSAAHATGYQTFRTGDRSTNNWFVALMSFGEGWHNNHHAFPFSARHGMRWFEFDMTWLTIRLLRALRIARNVRLPSRESIERLTLPNSRRVA